MTIGEKIKTERLRKKLTQSEIAGDRITRNMLSAIESGTHKVTSIRKVGGDVQIEGTFDLVMEDNYGDIKKNVKGKYRITTEAYYTEGEY